MENIELTQDEIFMEEAIKLALLAVERDGVGILAHP